MSLQDRTVLELTAMYNELAEKLERDTVKKFKDKPTALEHLARIQTEHDEVFPPAPESKARKARSRGERNSEYHKGYNYAFVAGKKKPRQDKTLTSKFLNALRQGASIYTLQDLMAEKTGELLPGAAPMRTSLGYRQWRLTINMHHHFGYGLKCVGDPLDGALIYLIEGPTKE